MIFLDMTGKPCPIPVIETKKALKTLSPGETVSVLVDNDIARQNLQKMAAGLGHGFKFKDHDGGNILTEIKTLKSRRAIETDKAGLVVAVGRDRMGGGSDELGKILMKSFIFSLTEQATPPEHILFYNSGVLLSTEGATTLDDLGALAGKGSQISSCGACLNYFALTDKLAVGQVTNMYAIASTMAQAGRLINL